MPVTRYDMWSLWLRSAAIPVLHVILPKPLFRYYLKWHKEITIRNIKKVAPNGFDVDKYLEMKDDLKR
jgi:hypothetical protein